MDTRTNYDECDVETTRSFITLFRKCKDQFQFAIDGTPDDQEVRGYLIKDSNKYNGSTTIGITAINKKENFQNITQTLESMGVEILEENTSTETADSIGEYTAYTLTAKAPSNISQPWNVPHLLVYGSLTPEIEEAIHSAYGLKVSYEDIRNHYIIYGESVTEESKTKLSDIISRASMFDDDKQFSKSQVNTAEFI